MVGHSETEEQGMNHGREARKIGKNNEQKPETDERNQTETFTRKVGTERKWNQGAKKLEQKCAMRWKLN